MPELPDLLYVRRHLMEQLAGQPVGSVRVTLPVVLRLLVPGDLTLLIGQALTAVDRHSHFLLFRFGPLDLVVNPMLAGRFQLASREDKSDHALAFALGFGDRELRYLDDKQMGKVYLIESGREQTLPAYPQGALDVLSDDFTFDRFYKLLRKRRDQVRVFLLDKNALDSLGNAYADEVLFDAGLHPKTWCRSLSDGQAHRLHESIPRVLRHAISVIEARGEPIEVKVRDFLKVRGQVRCPRCGAKLRKAGVRGMDAYFCPHCQPASRAQLVDWRKTGR